MHSLKVAVFNFTCT